VSSEERLPVLDGLRAVSIVLVLAGHMLPLGPKFLQLNGSAAAMGMSLFFCLSGFLIAQGLIHNADIHEFVVRRFARIIPLAYAYSVLTAGVLYFDPKTLLAMTTFLLNYRDHLDGYNAHFWSLCVEVHFYVAIAIVVAVAGKKGIWIVWPACLAVMALRAGEGAYSSIMTHLRVDEILAGACVATLYQKSWRNRLPFPIWMVALAALLWFLSGSPYTGWFQYLRSSTTALLLAVVLCQGHNWLVGFLSSRPMRYIATISYALYVVHVLTIQGWLNEGGTLERYVFKRPISLALTWLTAHLSTFYWERPWQLAAKRWIEHRRKRQLQLAAYRPPEFPVE
jgi:peptidoglycan/LPS O-acetylase OafA/YrhL